MYRDLTSSNPNRNAIALYEAMRVPYRAGMENEPIRYAGTCRACGDTVHGKRYPCERVRRPEPRIPVDCERCGARLEIELVPA